MAWRVIDTKGESWQVEPAAERCANQSTWQLTLAFRAINQGTPCIWASYPIESPSKSKLFDRAELLSDDDLRSVLVKAT